MRCLDCQRSLSWRARRQVFSRLLCLGVQQEVARTLILPRCDVCVTRYLARGPVLLPTVAIARSGLALAVLEVLPGNWQAAYAQIRGQGSDFVAVRLASGNLLVVTTAHFEGINRHPALPVAARVESAIMERPAGVKPRFVASRAWGGDD